MHLSGNYPSLTIRYVFVHSGVFTNDTAKKGARSLFHYFENYCPVRRRTPPISWGAHFSSSPSPSFEKQKLLHPKTEAGQVTHMKFFVVWFRQTKNGFQRSVRSPSEIPPASLDVTAEMNVLAIIQMTNKRSTPFEVVCTKLEVWPTIVINRILKHPLL